ncbi:hypothetical protein EIP91_002625 [Steccherinum ochraceum]|uniref:Uncharacterized protein n=1 Tax=Steccherinum ochraceum TaxID=92696 RepID=A0A4R0RV96_9APHY|nr:hypothetical protein EIP91_002625 [Steccherinum ochraceum]
MAQKRNFTASRTKLMQDIRRTDWPQVPAEQTTQEIHKQFYEQHLRMMNQVNVPRKVKEGFFPSRSIVPFANSQDFREVDRFSSKDFTRLIIPLSMGAIKDTIVILDERNAIGCEKLRAGQHGCVWMPWIGPELNIRDFHLFVKAPKNKIFYKGRYTVPNFPTHQACVDEWNTLSPKTKWNMAEIVAGRERLGAAAVPGVIEEYNQGKRRLVLVALFCGYYDLDIFGNWCVQDGRESAEELLKPATRFPAKF